MIVAGDVLEVMAREPGRTWTPSELSAPLDIAPDACRRLLRKLVDEGHAQVDAGSGRYRLCDVRGAVLRFLRDHAGQEYPPKALALALPELGLDEYQMANHLAALYANGELWSYWSVPTFEQLEAL